MIKWGIDLGGTKIECAVIDHQPGGFSVLCRQRLPTEAHKGYDHILNQITILIQRVSAAINQQPTSLGVATPGILDRQRHQLKNANVLCLNGKNLPADLTERLAIPVFHANDANCFALAETHLGAASTHITNPRMVFGVILGTGVGGGLVINGQLYEGLHGIAGEWGHIPLAPSPMPCYCGQSGCVEQFISGPALEAYYTQNSHKSRPLLNIYESYLTGSDPIATDTVKRLLTLFGKAIAIVINTLDPEIIVLGGGVSNLPILYQDLFPYVRPHLFNPELHTPILKNQLGDSAGVFGAALLNP